MKRLLNYLFIFLVLLLPFNTLAYGVEYDRFEDEYNATDVKTYSSGSFDLIIDDQANLLTEEEEIKLQDEMTKLLEYGNSFNNYLSSNNIDDCKIVCTSSGLIPGNGKYGFAITTTAWDGFGDTFTKLQKGALLYTRDGNVYLNLVEGVPETYPTHTEGIVNNGTCSLLWVDTLGKAKIINF